MALLNLLSCTPVGGYHQQCDEYEVDYSKEE
jgi:hypothetical protein